MCYGIDFGAFGMDIQWDFFLVFFEIMKFLEAFKTS